MQEGLVAQTTTTDHTRDSTRVRASHQDAFASSDSLHGFFPISGLFKKADFFYPFGQIDTTTDDLAIENICHLET